MSGTTEERRAIQTAYEEIRAYFSKPGAKLSKSDRTGACLYLNEANGRKCAVGCRIPNELILTLRLDEYGALTSISNQGVITHFNDSGIWDIIGHPGTKLFDFHMFAQNIHDSQAKDADDFVSQLDGLATDFDLDVYPNYVGG